MKTEPVMDSLDIVKKLEELEATAYGYSIDNKVAGMDCDEFEHLMFDAAQLIKSYSCSKGGDTMSGDCMQFPEKMEDFVEEYSFKDRDEVYTNGSDLIPTFRVKQAIEHYHPEAHWNRLTHLDDRDEDTRVYRCSRCLTTTTKFSQQNVLKLCHYCHCGARMVSVVDE